MALDKCNPFAICCVCVCMCMCMVRHFVGNRTLTFTSFEDEVWYSRDGTRDIP